MERLRAFIRVIRFPVWILEGMVTGTRHRLTMLYGGPKPDKAYFVRRAFADPPRETFLGKKWIWTTKRISSDYGCNLSVRPAREDIRLLLQWSGNFYIPSWVSGEVDTTVDRPEESLRSDLRRIRRNKLEYEVTRDPTTLDEFYHEMYVPSVTGFHGEGALLMGYTHMMDRLQRGACELLLIKKDSDRIAGVLIVYEDDVPRLWSAGVRNGDRQYLGLGAEAATYAFPAQHLRAQGHKRLNIGLSRGFLRDGVLRYKKKWGLRLVGTSANGFLLRLRKPSEGLRVFLNNNPFIFVHQRRLTAAIFTEGHEVTSDRDWNSLKKQYGLPGIARLILYRLPPKGLVNVRGCVLEQVGQCLLERGSTNGDDGAD